ncbi:unnamed protein product [Adineta ricciae]|uniref:Uncharacterized protein n=1 Tax=Adineta ricciae TaxID=249248 RepID=A0A815FGF3_ADIRI|nr:unnamed protein product [Adineta ricciae]
MTTVPKATYSTRKWIGVVFIFIELFTASATIYGFSALYNVLANNNIYRSECILKTEENSNKTLQTICRDQSRQYENAATLGIAIFDLSAVIVGIVVDSMGARFIRLIAIVLHIVGWFALALVQPDRDYLIYVHTACTSLSGSMITATSYIYCGYFPKSRAFISSLFVGVNIASCVWYSFFQMLIDADLITLSKISFIWSSLAGIMLVTSFWNFDWKFSLFNLPYKFDTSLEETFTEEKISSNEMTIDIIKLKWYQRIYKRTGVWKHLTSPLYILTVLYLAILFTPATFLSATWYPRVYHITNHDESLTEKYTIIFNISAAASIIICPIHGFLLDFQADRSKARQWLNISISQTITWLVSIISCILCMFVTTNIIIVALIFNGIAHATIEAGNIAIIASCFPSEYLGTLTGVMWTVAGLITLIQYALNELTYDIPMSWRAWLILAVLITLMLCHVVQVWRRYANELKHQMSSSQKRSEKVHNDDVIISRL